MLYNSLSRKMEEFVPMNPQHVGLYVCGPTVYGDPHLGHARPAVTFDILFRYLKHKGYQVRYVRNITDVGHLENDADEGEDKISKKARLEQLEPMEVAQYYTNRYHDAMDLLNVLRPSIEPHASGHIIEQIAMTQKILDNGYAYVSNGSVYFDVEKYNKDFPYGILSGRKIEELQANTRELDGQSDKRGAFDFALWKKAQPEHIMRWPSPWSDGFPGWHMECSAMSAKYLGEQFDIHGGGMDLMFPHHECEIAQSCASLGHQSAKYWVHNNMITIDGKKMGKSLGNFITLEQMFTGNHPKLNQAYSPMTIRFFMLQAHYRSTLDFTNDALQASEKGLSRLMNGLAVLQRVKPSAESTVDIAEFEKSIYTAMDNDLNTPIVISTLFEWTKTFFALEEGKEKISAQDLELLRAKVDCVVSDILGLQNQQQSESNKELLDGVIGMVLAERQHAKERKDWATSDAIRDRLKELGITVKDGREGATWEFSN